MNRRASNIFRRVARPSRGARPTDVAESMERAERLDPVVEAVQSVARRVLPPGRLRDLLNGVPFGHPAHAPMTDLPIGCWISAGVLDLLPGNRRAAGTLVAAGLAGAVPTALAGLADWSSLHREQQRTGLVHAFGTSAATALYAASLVARLRGRDAAGRALGFAGLTAVLGGAYLGGHLAYRQAAGVSHADPVQHLVPLGWHDLCSLDDLPPGAPVSRRLGYIALFVLRIHDDIHVLTDRCSHLGGPLHQGRIVYDRDDELCVVCPWHGSTFRVDDGAVVHGPATGRQPAFETRVLDNGVVQVRPLP